VDLSRSHAVDDNPQCGKVRRALRVSAAESWRLGGDSAMRDPRVERD
jgi:hypothetical protein